MSKKIIGITVGSPLPKPNLKQNDPAKGDYVKGKDIIPTKVSQLQNDSGFITDYTETDPTVPSWAKQASKPGYTAAEVGARPSTWTPSASDVGADPKGTAANEVSEHNTADSSHGDIRLLITGLTNRLNALANSTDTDLDQMAELVAYIKNNKSLIDGITTGKVSVSDIVNNLTTNVSNKPLSAAQGVALKALIDAITIPTKLSQLTNDKGYITDYTETDPTVPAWAKNATKPSYSKSEVGLGNVDNVKQYSASNPPPYPVTSVNGKTGVVSLDAAAVGARPSTWMPSASDVGALPASTTIPTKVSQLTNDKGYLTQHQDISGKVDKNKLTLGVHEDGLIYVFVDGQPVGNGVELPTGGINGYVTPDNKIIIQGLPDGSYTAAYEYENGSTVNIGNLVVDTNVYYTVTNTLTQCTTNNSATKAVQGGSYSATITAKSGYELKSIVVKMGGTDISSTAVSGGKITISNVTGNIVITAVAEEIKAAYNNILDGDYAIELNKRWSNSSKGYTACNGMIAFTIPKADVWGKTIRFKGFPVGQTSNNNKPLWMTIDTSNSRVNNLGGTSDGSGNIWDSSHLTQNGDVYSLPVNATTFAEVSGKTIKALAINMAFGATAITAIPADAIMTIDEEIV